jgi:hypothetical protein
MNKDRGKGMKIRDQKWMKIGIRNEDGGSEMNKDRGTKMNEDRGSEMNEDRGTGMKMPRNYSPLIFKGLLQ